MHASPARRIAPRLLAIMLGAGAVAAFCAPSQASVGTPGSRGTAADPCTPTGATVLCAYTYTGHEEQFVVPVGVTSVDVEAIGAAGASYPLPSIGRGIGGRVTVDDLAVMPGQTLYVAVGGTGAVAACAPTQSTVWGGAGGWNGGADGGPGFQLNCPVSPAAIPDGPGMGGGGASDVRTHSRADATKPLTGDPATDPRILVAGGGGGNADYSWVGGQGGGPDDDGDGGRASGDGWQGSDRFGTGDLRTGGHGGTATAGGQPGWNNDLDPNYRALPGSAGAGGRGEWYKDPFNLINGGGGGGGGWFGGGGGTWAGSQSQSAGKAVGGGGGGSSMVPPGGTIEQPSGEAARVVITYTRPADLTAPAVTVAAPVDGATYHLGTVVAADFACADEAGGWGLTSCTGTTAVGDEIDTASIGTKSFSVTASDEAGNTATKTVQYEVVDPNAPKPGTDDGSRSGSGTAGGTTGGGATVTAQSAAVPQAGPGKLRILDARLNRDGTVVARVAVPGAGTVIGLATVRGAKARASALQPGPGRATYAEQRLQQSAAGVVTLRLTPNRAARRRLARTGAAVRLTVAFGRPPHDLIRQVRLLRLPKAKARR